MNKPLVPTLILFFLLTLLKPATAQDYLVERTYLGSRSQFELLVLFGQPVDYGVDLYRIRYKTLGSDNLPDTASGLLVLPQVPAGTSWPMVLYEHGTTDGPNDVPSQLRGGFEVAMAYAASGFITAAPDYLGLGTSRGFHPYVHAATEASASLDMLNGSLEYLDLYEPDWDPNYLFVAGYSQGGHASMAVHREIEDFWSFVYPVTAATHMSGPYSISGVMRDLILSDESYGSPAYIAYIVLGYQEVYGNIYNQITDVFKEPYASAIENFHNGLITLTTLNNQLISQLSMSGDTVAKRMLQDDIVTAIEQNDPSHPINFALADNDTYAWAPVAPTRLYYCGGDEQVPYQNSLVAEAEMNNLGAADVKAENLNPTFSHGQCVFPAVLASIDFFQSFVHPSAVQNLDRNAAPLTVVPNPATDDIRIDWDAAAGGMDFRILNAQGQIMYAGRSYFNRIAVDQLPAGVYSILCTANGQTRVARFIHP